MVDLAEEEIEAVEVLIAEGRVLAAHVAGFQAVGTVGHAKCLKQHVVTVEKNVKFLLDQQMVNRFIAVTVLRKWETAAEVKEDMMRDQALDLKLRFLHQISLS